MQSYNPAFPGCTFSRLLNGRLARKQENAGKPRVLAINVLLHSLVVLAATRQCNSFLLLTLIIIVKLNETYL